MNISEKVIDIVKGMEGIGGIPTDEEFLNEFEFRLQALKKGQSLPIDSVVGQCGQLVCSCGSIKVQTTGGSQCPNNRCGSAN